MIVLVLMVVAASAFADAPIFGEVGSFSNGTVYTYFSIRGITAGSVRESFWDVSIYQNGNLIPDVLHSFTDPSVASIGRYITTWSSGLFIYNDGIEQNGPYTVVIESKLDNITYTFEVTGRYSATMTTESQPTTQVSDKF